MLRSGITAAALAALSLASAPVRAQQPAASKPDQKAAADDPKSYQYIRDYGLKLDFHNIGPVLPQGKVANTMAMFPSGFRADTYDILTGNIGLGEGWQIGGGGTLSERLGRGGEAIFYDVGVQKQFVYEKGSLPAISLGAYASIGPHDHHAESIYLAATKKVAGGSNHAYALFVHGGGQYDRFDSDDYGSGSDVRPFIGTTLAIKKRFYLRTDYSPRQPWARRDIFSVSGSYRVWKYLSLGGGIHSNGYRTLPFIRIGIL